MSNLGLYQTMTKVAKKLGGPLGLLAATAIAGYAVLRSGEAGVKKILKTFKSYKKKNNIIGSAFIIVSKEGTSNEGVVFNVGDEYRVLDRDGEAILIEKKGDTNNPYFVSADFLNSISNFSIV